jgi:hypothetical protein
MIGAEHRARFFAANFEAAIDLRAGVFLDGAERYKVMH